MLSLTGADGVMIGRAAQGRPWLFREIAHYLERGQHAPPPTFTEMGAVLTEQLLDLYDLYGCEHGARIARKHIGWTVSGLPGGEALRRSANAIIDAESQLRVVHDYFAGLAAGDPRERLAA